MKTIIRILKWLLLLIPKMLHKLIVFTFEIISIIVIAIGVLLFGIGHIIKDPKSSYVIMKESIKQIKNNYGK